MQIGQTVQGRFEVVRLAGSGGMGKVYLANDQRSGVPVALKVLHQAATSQYERFEREARVLAELAHPNVVRYVAHGKTDQGEPYLVMEWLEGEDLSARLIRMGLTIHESLTVVRRIADGLATAHERGIVHRDVKPKNVLLVDCDVGRPKVLDFGIARLLEHGPSLTATGLMLGTPGYTAPEQARGMRKIDARADVFALGCVMFKCLTGTLPFKGDDIVAVLAKVIFENAPRVRDVRPDVPAELDDLVARMLSKNRAARPKDGAAVSLELAAALGSLGAEPASRPSQLPPALTAGEQRTVSVVVAAKGDGPEPHATEETMSREAYDAARGRSAEVRAAVAPFGARLEPLANGSMVAIITSKSSPTEQVRRAARAALAMHALLGDTPMALATARAEMGGAGLGGVIDRAASMLHVASDRPGAVVRIDETTAGLLDAAFEVVGDAGHLGLRGERDEQEEARLLLGKPTPCVGRARELSILGGVLEECLDEPVARAVLVTGPSGVGKSRLRYELTRRVREGSRARIWIARGDPMSIGSPFGLLGQLVRRGLGVREGEPAAVQRAKLRARLSLYFSGPDLARVLEFVGVLAQVPGEAEETVQMRAARRDAVLMGDQLRRAWEDLLSAACKDEPLLLVLEDLHWSDAPTVTFIDAALRALHDAPLMVLALARADVHESFPTLWEGRPLTTIALSELTKKAGAELARSALGDGVSEEVVSRIVERSQGNAFYLEELIRALAEKRDGASQASPERGLHDDDLPDTVLAMVEARLSALPQDARRVLRAASVFGQMFWARGVDALLGAPDTASTPSWLAVLEAKEIVSRRAVGGFPGEDELVFRSALVRDAAYGMLTLGDRRLGHKLAGEWLERAGTRDAMMLAEHFERGGRPDRALTWYRRAAEQALGANDFEGALARIARARTAGAQGALLGALCLMEAEARNWRAEYAAAEESGVEAMELLPRGSEEWYAAAGEIVIATGRDRPDRFAELAGELTASDLPGGESLARVNVLARLALRHMLIGKVETGEALLACAEHDGRELVDADPLAYARLWASRAIHAHVKGDTGAYLEHTEAASRSFGAAGDLRARCIQSVNIGSAKVELGAYEEAEAVLRETLATANRMGITNIASGARQNLAAALTGLGRLDEAMMEAALALEAFKSQGDRRMEAGALIYLGLARIAAHDLQGGLDAALAARDVVPRRSPVRGAAMAVAARASLSLGHAGQAVVQAREAVDVANEVGSLEAGESLARLVHAEALAAMGNMDGARIALASAKERLLSRANRLAGERWRRGFLERVPDNARTLALAAEWGL